jgi:hypothetical protein
MLPQLAHTINEVFTSQILPAPFTEEETKAQKFKWLTQSYRASWFQSMD